MPERQDREPPGSFEAGVGAQPGVIMPADPVPGLEYRQEYYAGRGEDHAKVLSVDEQTEVAFGHFTGVLLTKDLVPLEPRVSEYKLYGRGGPAARRDDVRRRGPGGASCGSSTTGR